MARESGWVPEYAPPPSNARAAPLSKAEAHELDTGSATLERHHELLYRDMMFGRIGVEYRGLI